MKTEAWRTAGAVFVAGGTGALARFWVSSTVQAAVALLPVFPWGTALVNGIGCLAAGALIAALEAVAVQSGVEVSLFYSRLLLTGFLGGFTTFSAFSVETLGMLRIGQTVSAAAYVLGSAFVFPALCGAGFVGMRAILTAAGLLAVRG